MAKTLNGHKMGNLDLSKYENNAEFSARIELNSSDETIRKKQNSLNGDSEFPSFLYSIYNGRLYMRANGEELLTPEGFAPQPIYHANEMFSRIEDYLSEDQSRYSDKQNPVELLDVRGEPDSLTEWMNRHTISAKTASTYPRLTIIRDGDKMYFNYRQGEDFRHASSSVEGFVLGMKSFASKLYEWADYTGIDRSNPIFNELHNNIEKVLDI